MTAVIGSLGLVTARYGLHVDDAVVYSVAGLVGSVILGIAHEDSSRASGGPS